MSVYYAHIMKIRITSVMELSIFFTNMYRYVTVEVVVMHIHMQIYCVVHVIPFNPIFKQLFDLPFTFYVFEYCIISKKKNLFVSPKSSLYLMKTLPVTTYKIRLLTYINDGEIEFKCDYNSIELLIGLSFVIVN